MFQSFEPVSDRGFASKHLPKLREQLLRHNLQAFIVPHDDEYQNEYIPAYAERLMWVSGFSGSAGAAIVFMNRAVIFTDGRYTLQVRQQVDENFYSFEDSETTSLDSWLKMHATKGDRIGFDPLLHTKNGLEKLRNAATDSGFDLVAITPNPIDEAWDDQPARPKSKALPHDISFAGKSSDDKRADIGKIIEEKGADAVLITAPPSINWLFNIRGGDVDRTPLTLARALIHKDGTGELFIAPEKVSNELPRFLGSDIEVRPEASLIEAIDALAQTESTVAIDPSLTPVRYVDSITDRGGKLVQMSDPCALPRATKNATELEGTRQAHIRDGAAVTSFLHWLATHPQPEALDEISAAKKLESFRSETGNLKDISFDTISGSGPNGAICHYKVSTETNRKLDLNSLYLVDSGGQYQDGTTDITRTVPVGTPTQEMRDRFTRVLKGHIALATMKFPKNTTGHQLDVIARRPLWEAGLDYDHGTGHGVGSFLGVHEGPQRISKASNTQPLKPGMILSNEPGYYKENEFGIRIENLVIVTPPAPIEDGEREMLSFETITLAPICLDLVVASLLSEQERHWLNKYHARVRQTLSPFLSKELQDWLTKETRSI